MNKKEAHELFVRNPTGSSSFEVFALLAVIGELILLRELCAIAHANLLFAVSKHLAIQRFMLDVAVVVLPMLAIITIFSGNLTLLLIQGLWFIIVALCVVLRRQPVPGQPATLRALSQEPPTKDIEVISQYRGTIVLLTSMTILAVDFQCFPRWMAKTEVEGYSVMDLGVGAFVIANALVAPQTREVTRSSVALVLHEVKDSLLLFLLGFVRFVSVMAANYQAPADEYGKHWNFFFTLAFVKVFGRICAALVSPNRLPVLGAIIIIAYETCLQNGLDELVLTSAQPASSIGFLMRLVLENRSGLSSCVGFLGLFLLWLGFAGIISAQRKMRNGFTTIQMIIGSLAIMMVTQLLPLPSRRLANASYVLWTSYLALAFMVFLVAGRLLTSLLRAYLKHKQTANHLRHFLSFGKYLMNNLLENRAGTSMTVAESKTKPYLLTAMNFNSMFLFLVANVLTGAVNLSTDTMQYSFSSGVVILAAYSSTIACVASFLYIQRIKVPLKLGHVTHLFSGLANSFKLGFWNDKALR